MNKQLPPCRTCRYWYKDDEPDAAKGYCWRQPPNGADTNVIATQSCGDHSDLERERMRDTMAGQAVAGLLAADAECSLSVRAAARIAYDLADAMLAARDTNSILQGDISTFRSLPSLTQLSLNSTAVSGDVASLFGPDAATGGEEG